MAKKIPPFGMGLFFHPEITSAWHGAPTYHNRDQLGTHLEGFPSFNVGMSHHLKRLAPTARRISPDLPCLSKSFTRVKSSTVEEILPWRCGRIEFFFSKWGEVAEKWKISHRIDMGLIWDWYYIYLWQIPAWGVGFWGPITSSQGVSRLRVTYIYHSKISRM